MYGIGCEALGRSTERTHAGASGLLIMLNTVRQSGIRARPVVGFAQYQYMRKPPRLTAVFYPA